MTRLSIVAFALFAAVACREPGALPTSPTPAGATPPMLSTVTTTTPTTTPAVDAPTTYWLINVVTGAQHTLISDLAASPYSFSAAFVGNDSVAIGLVPSNEEREFSLGGVERARRAHPLRCKQIAVLVAEIDGQRYEVNCGTFSPDANQMAYGVDRNMGSDGRPTGEQWLLDLRSGRRSLVRAGLRLTLGTDALTGPNWSPSSRYFAFREAVIGGESFIFDTATGSTRLTAALAHWASSTDMFVVPEVAPELDHNGLLRDVGSSGSVLEDLTTGRKQPLPGLNPTVRFDLSDRFVFAVTSGRGESPVTTIVSVADGTVVARLPGALPNIWNYRGSTHGFRVIAADSGIAATLEGAAGCMGTTIYHPQLPPTGRCTPGSAGAVYGPSLKFVALARQTGSTAVSNWGGGGGALSCPIWEIVLVDPITGAERTLARNAVSPQAPQITWHPSESHILIAWPVFRAPRPFGAVTTDAAPPTQRLASMEPSSAQTHISLGGAHAAPTC